MPYRNLWRAFVKPVNEVRYQPVVSCSYRLPVSTNPNEVLLTAPNTCQSTDKSNIPSGIVVFAHSQDHCRIQIESRVASRKHSIIFWAMTRSLTFDQSNMRPRKAFHAMKGNHGRLVPRTGSGQLIACDDEVYLRYVRCIFQTRHPLSPWKGTKYC